MIQPNVIEHFREAMRAAGLEPPDVIEPGKLQRFSTNGKASDEAGWCLLFSDLLGGVFGDHRSGLSETWQAKRDKPVNEAERNAFKQRCEQVKHERRAEQVRKHAKAASQAQAIWQAAGEASHQHPYLARKGVKSHGLRVYRGDLVIKGMPCDGCLMVAARDVSGFIHTLEFIHPDPRDGDNKRFLFGGDWKGHYFSLGKLNGVLCIAEGYATGATIHEATGYAVAVAFNAGNLEPVARALRAKFPDLSLVLCADDDISTEGNPGLAKATAAAHAVRGLLAMPDFGDNRPERATDFNDLAQCRGLAAVRTCIANAKPQALDQDQAADSAPADDAETFKRLAALSLVGYDRCREQEAKDLGIRVGTLDKEVDRLRTPLETDAGAGTPMVFDEPEPWEEPVDGATLLDSLADTFTQHAKLPEHAPDALALWVLQTYSHEAAFICALLLLTSPQKRCGKTTVLALLKRLCYRSLPASNVTPAVVFRTVEKYAPTVLIDEADTFLKQSDELRGIINSGHSRDLAFVIRNVGEDHEPHRFSTWGPKAIAMIGNPAETIMDRSVVVKLTRKLPREKTARLRPKVTFADLTRQCARWAKDNLDQLTKAAPEMPANLNDRASDNWEFLVALADAAGGDWPERARKAAIALSGDDVIEDDSIKVQLLADIRDILAKWQQAYIPSRNLVEKLVALEDRPWCEFGRTGKPLTQRTLANLLHPFGITSGAHRRNNLVFKGYPVEKFQDACKRYIPSVSGKH